MIGATGMIGTTLLNLFKDDSYHGKITILTRRKIEDIPESGRITQHIVSFDDLGQYSEIIKGETLISTLGTTAKKAGSADKFIQVDHRYPEHTATIALENGAKNIILLSSIGADANSSSLYLATKGRLEDRVMAAGFKSVNILRPSLLMGNRNELRPVEEVGKHLSRYVSCLIPERYRPIHARPLAAKILEISKNPVHGINIFEGKKLYGN